MVSRVELAGTALGVARDGLVDAVCAFRGEPSPADGVARDLVQDTFAALDETPLDVHLYVHDLAGAADQWPKLPVTLPRTPWQAVTLVDAIAELVTPLPTGDLHAAAEGFGLRRGEVGAELMHSDRAQRRREELLDSGPMLMVDDPDPAPSRRDREAELLGLVVGAPSAAWTETHREAVTRALLLRLARLGDGLLRVSAHPPAPLAWTSEGTGQNSTCPVPGTTTVLEARLTPSPPERWSPFETLDDPLWGTRRRPTADHWQWRVGWKTSDGTFVSEGGTGENTLAAARFGAEQTIAAMLPAAATLRQRGTGRLLVTRTADELTMRDPALVLVTLRSLLDSVVEEHRNELHFGPGEGEEGWAVVPHTGPDGQLGLCATLLANLGLPHPNLTDPENARAASAPDFDRFLRANAVVLTPPARAYLVGLGDAGPGQQSFRDRHEAGLRAALSPATAEEHAQLVADIGALHSGLAWVDLLDPGRLEEFLEDSADSGDN